MSIKHKEHKPSHEHSQRTDAILLTRRNAPETSLTMDRHLSDDCGEDESGDTKEADQSKHTRQSKRTRQSKQTKSENTSHGMCTENTLNRKNHDIAYGAEKNSRDSQEHSEMNSRDSQEHSEMNSRDSQEHSEMNSRDSQEHSEMNSRDSQEHSEMNSRDSQEHSEMNSRDSQEHSEYVEKCNGAPSSEKLLSSEAGVGEARADGKGDDEEKAAQSSHPGIPVDRGWAWVVMMGKRTMTMPAMKGTMMMMMGDDDDTRGKCGPKKMMPGGGGGEGGDDYS